MYEQVRLDVRSWHSCARVKASFVPRNVVVHPLSIMGMFYCWSVALAGPFSLSRYENYYIMVMIEHFSKWVEVVTLPTKESCETARVFRPYVLCRYRAPAQVLTDQGTEFRGKFQEMLDEALIDHRKTFIVRRPWLAFSWPPSPKKIMKLKSRSSKKLRGVTLCF